MSQRGRRWGGRRGGYITGGRGRGIGQSHPYNQTVSLTKNNDYYYVITIREKTVYRNITINCNNYKNY